MDNKCPVKYILIKDSRGFCPNCEEEIWMLIHPEGPKNGEGFSICPRCLRIAQFIEDGEIWRGFKEL